jgi:hypothetical protein
MADYTNKFQVAVGDVTRIIFIDERDVDHAKPVAELIMTNANADALAVLLLQLIAKKNGEVT